MTKLQDSVTMNFRTDGLGFRRYKEVVGQSVTYFVYDLAASDTPGLAPLIAEYDANGNLVAKYHQDGGGLLAMTRSNATSWYGFEAIGTVRQLVNEQTQVTDAYAFDAWRNELATQGSTVNPHRYVGKYGYYLDTQSTLMLLGARFYASANGFFLSRDLIEGYGYTYGADNPMRWIDPQGLQFEEREHQTCATVNGEKVCAPQRNGKDGKGRDGKGTGPKGGYTNDPWGSLSKEVRKCLDDAINSECKEALKKCPSNTFLPILRCIVCAEVGDNLNIGIHPDSPLKPCGPFGITQDTWKDFCSDIGKWDTDCKDVCKNIRCGVRIYCKELVKNNCSQPKRRWPYLRDDWEESPNSNYRKCMKAIFGCPKPRKPKGGNSYERS